MNPMTDKEKVKNRMTHSKHHICHHNKLTQI